MCLAAQAVLDAWDICTGLPEIAQDLQRSCTFLRQNIPQNLKLLLLLLRGLTPSAATGSPHHCLGSHHCCWRASQDMQGDTRHLQMNPCTRCPKQQVSLLHPVPTGDTSLSHSTFTCLAAPAAAALVCKWPCLQQALLVGVHSWRKPNTFQG